MPCCLLVFGIEEAKVNRRTFFSIVALTTAAASKLYIHIDIVTVGVYEILPKTTEKKYMRKLMHTGRYEKGKKILLHALDINLRFCVELLLSMFFEHVRNSIELTRVCVRLTLVLYLSVFVSESNVRKIPSFIDILRQRGIEGDGEKNKSAQPHRQIFFAYIQFSSLWSI